MIKHALLSPSSSARWIACPGSKEGNKIASKSNAAADEGTTQHELASDIISLGVICSNDNGNLWEVTKRYVHFVHSLIADHGFENFVEETLYSSLMPDEFFGTLDFFVLGNGTLTVVDLKTGRKPVVAKDNAQLKSYLCLARDRFPDATKFFGCIVQNDPDMVEFTAKELDDHYLLVQESLDSDERYAGEHCEYCPLKLLCQENIEYLFDDDVDRFSDAAEPSSQYCQDVIDRLAVVEQAAREATECLKQKMLRGEEVDGWKLGHKLGNREWEKEFAESELSAFGILLHREVLRSPADFEKEFKEKSGLKLSEVKAAMDPLVTREVKPAGAYLETTKCKLYVPPVEELFEDITEEDVKDEV